VATEFRVGNHVVELSAVSGVVAQSSATRDRDYSERYSTLMGGSYMHSELREETNFFLQRDDGGELAVSFPARIPLRGGHQVTVVYGACSDGQSVTAIGMLNETLHSSYELPVDRLLARLEIKYGRAPVTKFGCATILVVIVFVILSIIFSPRHWGDWTLFSSRFWMFLAGWFVVFGAGL
jgi:hypothetical protein